jgi:LCP family protein required for cell wall assembly
MKKSLKIFLITLFFLLLILFIFFIYLSKKTNRALSYFPKTIISALKFSPTTEKLNFLILGVDKRDDWLEKTLTTDTIILSRLDPQKAKIHLISLPRDLWSYFTSTKINQIYPLSLKDDNSEDKFKFISQNFASISGQPIDKVLVFSTENLKELSDILGGVDLYLENGFRDELYPNEAYIKDPNSGAPVYKTVEFKSGWNHLDSHNISEFVRSRKSADTAADGGTDLGRIERQQLLINALIDKLKVSLLKKPSLVFELYQFWGGLEHNFSDTEVLAYLFQLRNSISKLEIVRHSISIGEDPKTNLIYHPQKFINSQWVYLPQDKDYASLHDFISQSLNSL